MKVKDIKSLLAKPVILESTDDYIGAKEIKKYMNYNCKLDKFSNVIILDVKNKQRAQKTSVTENKVTKGDNKK